MSERNFKWCGGRAAAATLMLCLTGVTVSGCGSVGQTYKQGYVLDKDTLQLVPTGSSREQVLLTLGTPSTTATFNDNKAFYYISQTRHRSLAFMKPRVVAQSILAVYFDKDGNVTHIANYSLKDGHVFDTISRTTSTGGKEQTFLSQILSSTKGVPQLPGQHIPGHI